MGRGDKKSKRGKISQGSYGKSRPGKVQKTAILKPVDKPQE
ncbi:30S ribosomal protein THX [Spirosoma horti]